VLVVMMSLSRTVRIGGGSTELRGPPVRREAPGAC
jgi:hypothetical protein